MPTHSFEFEQQENRARVTVDGVDIASAVTSLTVHADAWQRPRVTLDLSIHDVTKVSSPETELLIPDDTAKALVALGWTPPNSQPAEGTQP